jgi:hypothetical protein
MNPEDTDRGFSLALLIVQDAVRRSAALTRHFLLKADPQLHKVAGEASVPIVEIPLPWPPLSEDEITFACNVASNVIHGAGFPAEADQLAMLGEVHGHG